LICVRDNFSFYPMC